MLPAAERDNPAPAVDRWVVGHLLRHLESRHGQEPSGKAQFFLNLSGVTLNDGAFFAFVRDGLKRAPFRSATPERHSALPRLGVDYAQGYGLRRPRPLTGGDRGE